MAAAHQMRKAVRAMLVIAVTGLSVVCVFGLVRISIHQRKIIDVTECCRREGFLEHLQCAPVSDVQHSGVMQSPGLFLISDATNNPYRMGIISWIHVKSSFYWHRSAWEDSFRWKTDVSGLFVRLFAIIQRTPVWLRGQRNWRTIQLQIGDGSSRGRRTIVSEDEGNLYQNNNVFLVSSFYLLGWNRGFVDGNPRASLGLQCLNGLSISRPGCICLYLGGYSLCLRNCKLLFDPSSGLNGVRNGRTRLSTENLSLVTHNSKLTVDKESRYSRSNDTRPRSKQYSALKFSHIFFRCLRGCLLLLFGALTSRISAGLLICYDRLWKWDYSGWSRLRSDSFRVSASVLLGLLTGIFFYQGFLALGAI
jgi:hypothetical protein